MTRTTLICSLLLAVGAAPGLAQDAPKRDERTPEERHDAAEATFKRLDADRDLVLEGDELPNAGWLDRFDRDADDKVGKREFLEVMDRGPGFDRLFVLRDVRARVNSAMRQFDQDKNGLVAADEYPGDPRTFRKFDRNRDEQLERRELIKLAEEELDDIAKRMRSPSRYEFLTLFDLNYDRNVTADEYDGPARVFRKYDENGDGTVDYYEIYPGERAENMEAASPRPEDLNVIATLDANEDGRVSRDEWKGSEAAWKRLDRNGDGSITIADAR